MTEIFDTLINNLWLVDFTLLCILAALSLGQRKLNSSLITQGIIVIISWAIIKYQLLVNSFASPSSGQGTAIMWGLGFIICDGILAFILLRQYRKFKMIYTPLGYYLFGLLATVFVLSVMYLQFGPLWFGIKGPSFKVWQIMAYYLATTAFYSLAMYAIHQAHVASDKTFKLIARMYLLAFFVAANIQIVTFIEQYVWQSNYLNDLYQWGLASINVSTTLVTIMVTGLAIFQCFDKKPRTGILWNL